MTIFEFFQLKFFLNDSKLQAVTSFDIHFKRLCVFAGACPCVCVCLTGLVNLLVIHPRACYRYKVKCSINLLGGHTHTQ